MAPRYTDHVRTSTLAAVMLAVVLTACSQSTAPTSATGASNSPTSVVITATSTVPATTTTTSSTPTHTPVWLTVKYRADPVDIANPWFVFLDGGSSSLVDAAFYDSGNGYMTVSLNGTAYHYCGMPGSVWYSFTTASSFGSFFNDRIKGNFDCRTGFIPDY
jgi:hypothetical protein